ncbi:hypothetical protein [Bradyrhizobium elkanii]|uniref:hypothetical protein n=1 Tax=Bradyrhizobium elkanii TaxID=29448 RepID=UPI0015C3E8CF|nr:hypothetical protein [Bradyrhizobium elkanii]MCW2195048.1 hypothetical protein [Bradyrhizobium elkanii]NWL67257.1 hypothetical protein [Bradyrhizobium elkanii]
MSQDDCARALGISTPTLVKSFREEIATGVAKKRAEVVGMLYTQAKKGNATCIKKLEEMTRVAAAAQAMSDLARAGSQAPAPLQPPKPEKVGKKAERKAAAELVAASGAFQPPEPPKIGLVVDNTAVNE